MAAFLLFGPFKIRTKTFDDIGYKMVDKADEIKAEFMRNIREYRYLDIDNHKFVDADISEFQFNLDDASVEFIKISSGNKDVTIPASPEGYSFEYVVLKDMGFASTTSSSFLIKENQISRISKDNFSGLSYQQIFDIRNPKVVPYSVIKDESFLEKTTFTDDELERFISDNNETVIHENYFIDEDKLEPIYWNCHLSESPNGRHIIYSSNRVNRNSYAIFDMNIETLEETMVIEKEGVIYTPEGWIDNEVFVCSATDSGQISYCVVDLNGSVTPIVLDGQAPRLIDLVRDYIVYTPNSATNNEIYVMKRSVDNQFEKVMRVDVKGTFRSYSDTYQDKLAFVYAPTTNTHQRLLCIVDLNTSEKTIVRPPSEQHAIRSIKWLDDNSIYVVLATTKNGIASTDGWIYELGE